MKFKLKLPIFTKFKPSNTPFVNATYAKFLKYFPSPSLFAENVSRLAKAVTLSGKPWKSLSPLRFNGTLRNKVLNAE